MLNVMDRLVNTTQLRLNRVHLFKAKIKMRLELGQYILKTAETPQELIESFALRHEVFNKEFKGLTGKGLDFDRFDYFFDHLIIVHKETKQIIGTYRLRCSSFSKESYTELEFAIDQLNRSQGVKLELGRACIHRDYRKGSVISLLWRGIADYMTLCDAEVLFGCSSLKINDPREAALVYRYLVSKNLVTDEFNCTPTKKFKMKDFEPWYKFFSVGLDERHLTEAENLIPSLLKSYLKLGAKVACPPAFDEDFDCIDLLTILKRSDLADSLAQRFQVAK